MNWSSLLPLMILLSSLVTGLIIFCLREKRRTLRTGLNLFGAVTTLALIAVMVTGVYRGEVFETRLPLLPNMDLVLRADALSLLFITLSGLLWLVTTVYAIGYLEDSPNRSRFFGFFSFCVSATLGIALAGNLITFLIFYELLTLTTYPLVVHRGTPASLRAGRVYLAYTMLGGALLLIGVVWLKTLAGALDFTASGILAGMPEIGRTQLTVIFALLIAGLGVKAALVPLHGWLPIAMAAPAPVSALLHAVAVVKAGAFGIVRVVYDVYGIEFARELGLTIGLSAIAAVTIVWGSIRALAQDDLKKRLAYSTVSQVSYIALGTAIAGPLATIGGVVHLVHQGLMKITLFFCAGNLAETLGIHKVSQLNGVGRRMPWTMAAFTLAALGMIGMPPVAGFVSKWYLGVGAMESGAQWVLLVLAASSLLNAAYFLPIIYAAWFKPARGEWPADRRFGRLETHWMLLLPPLITTALALAAGMTAGWVVSPVSWSKLVAERESGLETAQLVQITLLQAPLLWAAVLAPLLLAIAAAAPRLRRRCPALAPWAALPALAAAMLPAAGYNELPWLFFGSVMGLDQTGRVFLLLAALLWLAAAFYARGHLRDDRNSGRFCVFFLLAMSGNFGLVLAQDMFGFITFFTLMSLAAYGLVIHSGTAEALRAGKTYMQWVIMGEVLLFAAFAWLVHSAGSADIRQLGGDAHNGWIIGLLLAGFGIKAGLVPLHVWLPRAHPVAPIPASAVLSGIMVKAGLLGWLRFLPFGASGGGVYASYADWGMLLLVLGLAGALLAVAVGVVQRNPKTLLAYSTISQMGILSAAVGAGLIDPALQPLLLPALLLYALHHGLAKGLLFLSVGLLPQLAAAGRGGWLWVVVLLPALALAGLPFTSGALAKAALKTAAVDMSVLVGLLPVTAVGTTLLMARFVDLMYQSARRQGECGEAMPGLVMPCLLLLPAVAVAVYLLPQAQTFSAAALAPSALWAASWPLLLGLLCYWLGRAYVNRARAVPAGDIVVLVEAAQAQVQRLLRYGGALAASGYRLLYGGLSVPLAAGNRQGGRALLQLQQRWGYWGNPGLVFLAVLLVVLLVTFA